MERKKKLRDGSPKCRSRSPVGRDHKKKNRHNYSLDDHQKSRKRHKHHRERHSRSPHNDSSNGSDGDVHRDKHDHNRQKGNHKERTDRPAGTVEVRFDPRRHIKEEPEHDYHGEAQHSGDGHRVVSRWELEEEPSRRIKQEANSLPEQQRHRRQNDDRRREARRQRARDPDGGNFGRPSGKEAESAVEKEKPNFQVSGKLTEDTNMFRGVVIKYNEPPEARKPKRRWRLYGFKGDDTLPMLPIHRQSAYLLGRDRRVADIPVDHPSCSKQHAVLQYRLTDFIRPDGSAGRKVRPYILDLGSANGTFVNNQRIEAQRYVELFERDLIKFGFSTREFVLLHENVDTSEVAENSDTD